MPKGVNYVQTDLLDREQTKSKLSPIADEVTNVFYVTWVMRDSEDKNIEDNTAMLKNLLGEARV